MSQYAQSSGILRCRNELDDLYYGKTAFRFSPLQGPANGTNLVFQIPQQRISIPSTGSPPNGANSGTAVPQIYIDDLPLAYGTDYSLTDPMNGIITFLGTGKQPNVGNKFDCTFSWTWFTDYEIDSHLNHGAAEVGYPVYYTTNDINIPAELGLPIGATQPTDIPDALMSATIMLGAAFAARALSLRFSVKYDTSAGDQSWSPSQMAKSFHDLADVLEKQGYTARDDFWKGQSRQYSEAIQVSGFVLPNVTPAR